MKNGSGNFFTEHYDWLVALSGLAALAVSGVFLVQAFGSSPEDGAAEYTQQVKAKRPQAAGIAANDMTMFSTAVRGVKSPAALQTVDPKKANFLASEYRVFCTPEEGSKDKGCGKPIPSDAEKCPFCGVAQPKKIKVSVDSDKDGLPNDYEISIGLNPNDPTDAKGDLDKDGFTNLEEYLAKTNPKDASDHPDYLDSLFVDGKLETTTLPVFFKSIYDLGGGKFRYVFRNPTESTGVKGVKGRDYTVDEGKEIPGTGFAPIKYEKKSERRKIKGGAGMEKVVDVSVATLQRLSDKRELAVVVNQKNAPIDMQAHLVYRRGEERKLTVAKGDEIELNGHKYKIVNLANGANGEAEVTVKPEPLGKEKVIKGLD